MKLLALGDIHLGRRPSRLPEELAGRAADFCPAKALQLTVDAAIENGVDAVLFAGDVVESEDDYFEALRELQTNIDRLTRAGIQVIAVAGNHDVNVLPRLADLFKDISGFRLLGRGGQWESHTIKADDATVHLWGWSFPEKRVTSSPLTGWTFDRNPGINLGLLHCDRDQHTSPYAPVMSREFPATGLDGWLLGHIHKPDDLTPDDLNGYLGCLSGMDPGETGARGPWLVKIAEGRITEVAQWPLAPVRWESLQVDLSDMADVFELENILITSTTEFDQQFSDAQWTPEIIGLRVTYTGRTHLGNEVRNRLSGMERQSLFFEVNGRHYFVEHQEVQTLPDVSLAHLAERDDLPGLLAQRLLLLDQQEDDHARIEMIRAAQEQIRKSLAQPVWQALDEEPELLDDEHVAVLLRKAGEQALDKLLAQQSESGK